MREPELLFVDPSDVEGVWPLCDQYITDAVYGTELSPVQLREQCASGEAQLWFAWGDELEAAAVTAIWDVPTGNVCCLLACGGKRRERWLWMLAGIEEWAKAEGCKVMRIFGRKGWTRVLHDYRVTRYVLDKEI